jgi:hypothetical protein
MTSIYSFQECPALDSVTPARRPERPATVLPLRLTAEAEWQLRNLLACAPETMPPPDGFESDEVAFLRARYEVAEIAFEEASRLLEQCESERDALKARVAQLEASLA